VSNRLKDTFDASKISRRLVMFQVWFMKNTTSQTLKGYNERLGRPQIKVKKSNAKTKFILNSKSWREYFNELDVVLKDDAAIDRLLRFAIYNSNSKGYHSARIIKKVNAPMIKVNGVMHSSNGKGKELNQMSEGFGDKVGIRGGSGRGWGNAKGSGWRGRGRGNVTMQRGRGRGRGSQSMNGSNGRGSSAKPYNSQRQNSQNNQSSNGHNAQPGMSSNGHTQMQQPGMPQQNKQNTGAGQQKLSKSQRQRLRRRLAKERAAQQQK